MINFNNLNIVFEKKNYNDINKVNLNINKVNFVIKLTIKQLVYVGIQIGHLKKNNQFLAAWLFYGWRYNIFIINLIKTLFLLKMALKMVRKVIKLNRPFWFITMNTVYGSYISRYASVCGEPFNVFSWISGSLTNLSMILGWYTILISLLKKQKYYFRHKDKKKLLSYYGFYNQPYYTINENYIMNEWLYKFSKKEWKEKGKERESTFNYNFVYGKLKELLKTEKYGFNDIKLFEFGNTYRPWFWINLNFFTGIWRKPGGGFIPTFLDNLRIVDEFAISDIPFITLIDSNIKSNDVMIPIPSNDDSIQCILFFTYLITRNIFISKVSCLKKWKYGIYKANELKYYKFKYVFLKNIEMKKKLDLNIRFENLLLDVFKGNTLNFDIRNYIKDNFCVPHEVIFSSNFEKDKFRFLNFNLRFFDI